MLIARQPLWSIAVWVALLDDQDTARRHLASTGTELKWALQLTGRIVGVQDALTNRRLDASAARISPGRSGDASWTRVCGQPLACRRLSEGCFWNGHR